MDLEHKACEFLLFRLHDAFHCLGRFGGGSNLAEAVEQFAHTEVVECRTEEDGGQLSVEVGLLVEVGIDTAEQFDVFAQFLGIAFADAFVKQRVVKAFDGYALRDGLLAGCIEVERRFEEVIDTLEAFADVDGPGEWTAGYLELLLHFVDEVEGILAFAVHLVDEDDDGGVAHAADLHKLACLRLDALGAVDDDDDAIDGCEGAVGIFGKVLVTRGVEDVDLVLMLLSVAFYTGEGALRGAGIVEGHDRGGYRDATLLLDLHPVGGGCFLDLVTLDGTSDVDGSTE